MKDDLGQIEQID